MVEIMDERFGKRVRHVINNLLHFGHCEIWSHFTRTQYFHLPLTHDNTDINREISHHISR